MCELLDALASKGHIVGFDITEATTMKQLGLRFLESIYMYRQAGTRSTP
jgi:hypothetical protein